MTKPIYEITLAWPSRPDPPELIGRDFVRTLDALGEVDARLGDWWVASGRDASGSEPLDAIRDDPGPFVRHGVCLDDFNEPEPQSGYWLFAANRAPRDDEETDDLSDDLLEDGFEGLSGGPSQVAQLFVGAGSIFKNWSSFTIGNPIYRPDPESLTCMLFKGVLQVLVSIWRPPWANAGCSVWGGNLPALPGEPPFPYSGYQMPWISYLDAERSAGLDPALLTDVQTERTPDGGLLMTATRQRFDPTNVAHMRPSRRIAELMIERGGKPGY